MQKGGEGYAAGHCGRSRAARQTAGRQMGKLQDAVHNMGTVTLDGWVYAEQRHSTALEGRHWPAFLPQPVAPAGVRTGVCRLTTVRLFLAAVRPGEAPAAAARGGGGHS